MSIVKVQRVAPVHFRVGKSHQMKKRHRMWLLLKVFADLEKVFSLKWGCPPREAFHWRRGKRSTLQYSLWSSSHIHTWLLEKSIALTIWAFVSKLISLLFNTLSRFVISFLPRSKCLLISWLQSLSPVILESKKIKSVTASTFPPCIWLTGL